MSHTICSTEQRLEVTTDSFITRGLWESVCVFGSVSACFCVKGERVSVRECVCVRMCVCVWQPKQVYRTVDFTSVNIFSGYVGPKPSPAPQLSASLSSPSPLLLVAFDEFGAYFLAESLGHVFWLVLEDLINGTFENWLFFSCVTWKRRRKGRRVVQDKLEDFKFSWWTLRIYKEGKSWDCLGPGPCFPAMSVFPCLFLEIRRQFRSAFLEVVMPREELSVWHLGAVVMPGGYFSLYNHLPPIFLALFTPFIHLVFSVNSAFRKSGKKK